MRKITWLKKGLVCEPPKNYTHCMLPCLIFDRDDVFVIAFSSRDTSRRSHIFLCRALLIDGKIEIVESPRLALSPGPLGHFDSDGVLTGSFLNFNGVDYLYYGGWENMVSVPYTANTGRLFFDKNTLSLEREFMSPVLSRNPQSPIFSGAPTFYKVGEELWCWYTSARNWIKNADGYKHYYSLRRAISSDGISWNSDSEYAIKFRDEYEYAIARSSIWYKDGIYYMWYSYRATNKISTYRIGLALSFDLLNWERKDNFSGIDVSTNGWDSEMICYPQIVHHKNYLYMIYNGNNYGETGFGYAVYCLDN